MAGLRPRRPQPRPGRPADSGLAAPASLGPPPPQPLPARHGSLPCRRLGSRRSARSPWRRAIRTARPAQRCSPSRTARSATPRSTWDVALAAARAGPHSPPGDGLRAAGPLRRRRQRPLPEAGGNGPRAGGRAGGAGPEGEELRLRARRLATGPRSGQDSSRRGVYRPGRKGPWLQRLLVSRVRKGREQMPSALGSWFILGLV